MRLLRLLSIVSRRRWPKEADAAPAIGVPATQEEEGCRGQNRRGQAKGIADDLVPGTKSSYLQAARSASKSSIAVPGAGVASGLGDGVELVLAVLLDSIEHAVTLRLGEITLDHRGLDDVLGHPL